MSVFDNPRFFPEFYDRIVWPDRVGHGRPHTPYVVIPVFIDGEKKYLNVKQKGWNYGLSEESYRFSVFQMFGFDAIYSTEHIEPINLAFGGTASARTDVFKKSFLTLSRRTTVEEAEHIIMMASLTLGSIPLELSL